MHTTNNPLVEDCSVENSDIKLNDIDSQILDENKLKETDTYFRDSLIEMVTDINYKEYHSINAFDATIDSFGEPQNYNHFINYKGNLYRKDNFLYNHFEDYKKYKKRVNFLDDNIFYLSSNQRNKLQYHILSQKYNLLILDKETDEKDKNDLLLFLKKYKNEHEQAQQWFNRMTWKNGHEKIITFGVSLEVQGTIKDVWCYVSDIDNDSATFNGVLMDWETWLKPITIKLDIVRQQIKQRNITDYRQRLMYYSATYENIKKMLYYQGENYLTLPATEITKIKAWVYKYLDNGLAPLPYIGNMPNHDLRFTIDFNKDIEIVDTRDIRDMSEYNRDNNDKHNKDMGKRRSRETFSRLAGDEWTTADIRAQGFTDKQIRTWRGYGWIEVKGKKGNTLIYKRVSL